VPYFRVTAENLMLGSSMIVTSGVGQGSAQLSDGGAAAGTPVAGAWMSFVDRADQALGNTSEVVVDLSRALRLAATAYELADASGARSLRVSR
jgi:hypothetical protein